MRGRWVMPLDPECPGMEEIQVFLNDPITRHYGVGDDFLPEMEAKHRRECERCQLYGVENVDVAYA